MLSPPDPLIIRARMALPPSGAAATAQALSLWDGLQSALQVYDAAVAATSLSSEGVSRSTDPATAAKAVAEWLTAYEQATASALTPEIDSYLNAAPLGNTFRYDGVSLRF